MVQFAEDLKIGVSFTASVAGTKKLFTKKEFQDELMFEQQNIDKHNQILETNRTALTEQKNAEILESLELESWDDFETINFPDQDIAKFDEDHPLKLEDIDFTLESFDQCFGCCFNDIKIAMTTHVDKLCDRVHKCMRTILGKDTEESQQAQDVPMFFDVGLELRSLKNTTLLLDANKTKESLEHISKIE